MLKLWHVSLIEGKFVTAIYFILSSINSSKVLSFHLRALLLLTNFKFQNHVVLSLSPDLFVFLFSLILSHFFSSHRLIFLLHGISISSPWPIHFFLVFSYSHFILVWESDNSFHIYVGSFMERISSASVSSPITPFSTTTLLWWCLLNFNFWFFFDFTLSQIFFFFYFSGCYFFLSQTLGGFTLSQRRKIPRNMMRLCLEDLCINLHAVTPLLKQ